MGDRVGSPLRPRGAPACGEGKPRPTAVGIAIRHAVGSTVKRRADLRGTAVPVCFRARCLSHAVRSQSQVPQKLKRASACPEDERRPVVPPLFSRVVRPSGRCSGRTRGQDPGDSRATFGCWCRGEVTAAAPPSLDGPELPTPPGRRRACHRLVLVYERHPGWSSSYASRRRTVIPIAVRRDRAVIMR